MKSALWIVALVTAIVVATPMRAEAGVPVVYNTGDDILELHDLPANVADNNVELTGYHVGWKYHRFGLFWLDLWRWGGEPVVFRGNTFEPVEPGDLEAIGGADAPLAYRLPPGLLLLLAGIEFGLLGQLVRSRKGNLIVATVLGATSVGLFIGGLGAWTLVPVATVLGHVFKAFERRAPEPASFRAAAEPAGSASAADTAEHGG